MSDEDKTAALALEVKELRETIAGVVESLKAAEARRARARKDDDDDDERRADNDVDRLRRQRDDARAELDTIARKTAEADTKAADDAKAAESKGTDKSGDGLQSLRDAGIPV